MSVLARSRKYLGILIWIFVFILCADVSGEIVYIKEQRTWIDAQNHCTSISGNLINPKTVNKVKDSVQVNEDFWIGEVTTLSSWMDILGCYFIPSLSESRKHVVEFKLVEPNPAICERLCQKYSSVFGLMGKECFCIKNMEIIPTLGKTKEAIMCNNTCKDFQVGLCGGGHRHYTIYMRITGTFRKHANSKLCDGFCKCIVAECSIGVKNQAGCQTDYAIACRNSRPISGMNMINNNWTEGIRKCYVMNQYLSGLNATCENLIAPVWTSTFRDLATLSINEIPADMVESHNYTYTKCSSVKFNNHSLEYSRDRNCNRIQMQFVCEINSYSNTQPKTGIIIGSVVACLLVAAGVVVVIIFLKYRNKSTKKKESTECNYEEPTKPSAKRENNGFAYDLANPKPNTKTTVSNYNTNRGSGYELASISNAYKASYPLRKNPGISKFKEMNTKDTGYELASIPKTTDNNYVYSDTVDGDYDLLNRKNERKKKINKKEDANFYSHTKGFDGTNDTANPKSYECDISDTYDHAQISKVEVAGNDKENDPYDHTNI